MRTINEVESEMNGCRKEIQELEKRLNELGLEAMEIKYSEKFPIGRDILVDGVKYKIIRYDHNKYYGEIMVSSYKKDGSLSKRITSLYRSEQERAVLLEA